MLSVTLKVIMLTVTYAECHIKGPYAEYRYAECRGAQYTACPLFP